MLTAGFRCAPEMPALRCHAYPDTPDDTDFPQAEAGARDFEGGNAAGAEEYQQARAEKFGQALAGQCGLA